MFPNADCGRARRESESGGSHIVSSHFDAELKTLGKKNKIKHLLWKMERGEGEERERRRREEKEGMVQNMLTLCIACTLAFVSLAVQLITFIEPDQELNSWSSAALKPQLALFLFVLFVMRR